MKRPSLFLFVSTVSILANAGLACGGAQSEPTSPESASPSPEASSEPAPASAAPEPAASTASTTTAAAAETPPPVESSSDQPDPGSAAPVGSDTSGRNIKYIVSPEGVRVKVDGVAFTPTAEATRIGKGWGIQVRVEAKSEDEAPHSLLAPKGSEVALAGKVTRSGASETEAFSDRRENDRDVEVTPKKTAKLSRAWPAKDGPKPLAPGDTLHMEVGIWGLGTDAASRKPVKRLCRIEVKFDKDKPRVKVMAPEGISK